MRLWQPLALSILTASASAQMNSEWIYLQDFGAECNPMVVFKWYPVLRCTYFQPTQITNVDYDPEDGLGLRTWEQRIPHMQPITGQMAWNTAPELAVGPTQTEQQLVLGGVYNALFVSPWAGPTQSGYLGASGRAFFSIAPNCNGISATDNLVVPGQTPQYYTDRWTNILFSARVHGSQASHRSMFLSGAHVAVRMQYIWDPEIGLTLELYGHTGQLQRYELNQWKTPLIPVQPFEEFLWMRFETFQYNPLTSGGGGGEPQIDYRAWLNALLDNSNFFMNTITDAWDTSDAAGYSEKFDTLSTAITDITVPGLTGPELPTGTDKTEAPEWKFTIPMNDITNQIGWATPLQDFDLEFDFEIFEPIRLPVHLFCLAMTSIWGAGRVWQELRKY